jgi:hypothetical protein
MLQDNNGGGIIQNLQGSIDELDNKYNNNALNESRGNIPLSNQHINDVLSKNQMQYSQEFQ